MNKTTIEYLTHTWSPIAMRCTPISAGCTNCWHIRMANRLAGNRALPPEVRDAYAGEGPPVLVKYRLDEPLRCKKPAVIGVQFMGDLFYKDIPPWFVCEVWQVMRECPQHTFQILTKRPRRALRLIKTYIADHEFGIEPLPNVHLGVSIEDQETADSRTPILLQTPAAVRFVSIEPMLEAIDLTTLEQPSGDQIDGLYGWREAHTMERIYGLDWVICGGETGPGARPTKPDWVRSIRDQCQAAGVPFFFKQWGEHSWPGDDRKGNVGIPVRVGKRAAGRQLDGREWNEIPRSVQ